MIRSLVALLCLTAPVAAQSVCDIGDDAAADLFAGTWEMAVSAEHLMHDGTLQEVMSDPRSLRATVEMSGTSGTFTAPFGGGTAILDVTPAAPTDDLGPLPDVFDDVLTPAALARTSGCDADAVPGFALNFHRTFPGGGRGALVARTALVSPDRAVGLQTITLTDPERGTARLVSRFDLTR